MTTKSKKANRARRYSDAKEIADDMSGGFTPTSFKVPDELKQFKFKEEKTYVLDIIPYTVGEGNPRADEGMVHFERSFYVHKNIGPDNNSYTCPYKNSGKKCPICQFKTKLAMDPKTKKEVIKALDPKLRQLYLVIDHDNREDGLQVFETAFWKSFGELLRNKVKAGDDDSPYQNFFHLEDGFYLKVTTEQDSFNGKTYYKPSNIEMRKRKTPLDDSLLEEAPCLDELVLELPYDELKDIFTQAPDEDDDEVEDDSELEDNDDEGEDDRPAKSSKGGSKKSPKKSGSRSKTSDAEEEEDSDDSDDDEVEDPSDTEDEEAEDSDDSDVEEDGPEIGKGDRVKGTYKDKTFKGVVTRVKVRKGQPDLISVETDGGNQRVIDADELTLLSKAKAEADDEGEDDEEDDTPKSSKKTKTSKGSQKSGGSSKTSSKKSAKDTDDDDDLPFEDDSDEEEE